VIAWIIKIILIIISLENLVHRIRTEAHTWPIFYVLNFGYLFKKGKDGNIKNDRGLDHGDYRDDTTNP
tara:strand:+ start:318 stop:521 length:204 start_codon:yes stop_codon:yes gene_type:complete